MDTTKGNDYVREILHQVFEKIKKENGGITNNKAATLLEDQLARDYKYSITVRTLVRYHSKYVEYKDVVCGIPTLEFNNYLAEILGFEDYNEFIQSLKSDISELGLSNKKSISLGGFKPKVKTNHLIMTGGFLIFIVVFYFFSSNKVASYDKQWMIWNEDRYVVFTNEMKTDSITNINLIPYNKTAIKYHQKITLKCESSIKKVWYYKVNNHELEFFNFPGLHPINRKTLKALTYNMKKKYVCNKENN